MRSSRCCRCGIENRVVRQNVASLNVFKRQGVARRQAFAQVAALPRLGDAVGRALYLLRPLSPESVREAVVGPARAKGFSFETPAMVDALVASAQDEGALPLLQFALTELWELRDPERLVLTERSLVELGWRGRVPGPPRRRRGPTLTVEPGGAGAHPR